jgi:uncharacterized protein YkwD
MTAPRARRIASLAVLASLLLLPACGVGAMGGAQASSGGAASAGPASPDQAAREVHDLLNRHRASKGCPALAWDDGAARVALAHSRDMRTRGYFSHTSPEGRTPFQRLDAAGLAWRAAAENIAQGQMTAAEVVRGWIASPGHRANIENCGLTRHGVGVSGGLWTDLFYTPR